MGAGVVSVFVPVFVVVFSAFFFGVFFTPRYLLPLPRKDHILPFGAFIILTELTWISPLSAWTWALTLT